MGLHIQHDWLPVSREIVEIRRHGKTVRRGRVETVTPDGAVLWLAADGPHTRGMFERSEGYEVWIEYKWEIQTLERSWSKVTAVRPSPAVNRFRSSGSAP